MTTKQRVKNEQKKKVNLFCMFRKSDENPRKRVQDRSQEFLENNNNDKISWKSQWSQYSLHDKYGWSKAKEWR